MVVEESVHVKSPSKNDKTKVNLDDVDILKSKFRICLWRMMKNRLMDELNKKSTIIEEI